jgi:nitrogen regulatory protein PII
MRSLDVHSLWALSEMRQLTIVVKPYRAEAVLQSLAELGVDTCVVREAKGFSRQKGYLDRYVGSEYSMAFLPKVEITVDVHDEQVEAVVETVARTARTGRMGDGKIFVVPLAWPQAIEF